MEPIKFTLCPHCTECPEVEITDQGVRILAPLRSVEGLLTGHALPIESEISGEPT